MDESWAEQDYSSWLPTDQQRRRSLERLRFSSVGVVAEPVLELIGAFRAMLVNGGAYAAAFEVVESDEVASCFCLLRSRVRRPLRRRRRRLLQRQVDALVQGSRLGQHLGHHRQALPAPHRRVHHRRRLIVKGHPTIADRSP